MAIMKEAVQLLIPVRHVPLAEVAWVAGAGAGAGADPGAGVLCGAR